jgi:hypothetical protein
MLKKLCLLVRTQDGTAQLATLAGICALVALIAATFLYQASGSEAYGSGDAAGQRLAVSAARAAVDVARADHDSFARTSLLTVHKVAALPVQRAAGHAWVSDAHGNGRTFAVTATAEPSGDTYTVSGSNSGTVSRSCTVARSVDAGVCRNVDSSGRGTW